jgi:hypothetical protein
MRLSYHYVYLKNPIMNKKQIITLFLTIFTSLVYGQSKKELNETISKLNLNLTTQELKIKDNNHIIDSLKNEILNYVEFNKLLQDTNNFFLHELQKLEVLKNDTNSYITHFILAFYNSLELSEAEYQRHYKYADISFDLDNFYCLIAENAKYSLQRVEMLSDEYYHDRYYIELLSIEDIKFVNNKITASTKVLYVGYEMGSFYNKEQLIIEDDKGLLKLTSWLDIDLYKMERSEYDHMENFTKDNFYKWIGSYNKN